ncbi:MAG: MBL fold metallo-hydrolase [Pedobacter sp.]|nr:MAG: MBL fold metallo-hydrolase [Pedobacter sp.]
MQVYTLYEGSYSVDASKKFIPFDPKIHQAKDRPASLFVHVQPFLVKFGSKLLLLDTGLGFSDDSGALILHQNIRRAGFNPDEVDYILMSHLHFDHAGGMVHRHGDKIELSFPQATYVINRGEWEAAYSSQSRSYDREILDYLQRNASLDFIEGSGEYLPGIHYEFTGAHCPNHIVYLLGSLPDSTNASQNEQLTNPIFFGGDVWPEPEEILRKFIAKYDYDGRLAMELREKFAQRAISENWKCLFYHAKTMSQAHIGKEGDKFLLQKID